MLVVRNWRQFQHYRDRNPPWIKLHFDLLSSRDWVTLPDPSRVLIVACMLIASRNDGHIDDSPTGLEYLRHVAYIHGKIDLKPLIDCGFLEYASTLLADRLHAASTIERAREVEVEVEVEEEKKEEAASAAAVPLINGNIPSWLSDIPEWWDYIDSRRQARNKLTPQGEKALVGKLQRFRDSNIDVSLALRTSLENGWKGVFEPKSVSRYAARPEQTPAERAGQCVKCGKGLLGTAWTQTMEGRVHDTCVA